MRKLQKTPKENLRNRMKKDAVIMVLGLARGQRLGVKPPKRKGESDLTNTLISLDELTVRLLRSYMEHDS
jgi:hypothetical protein